MSTQNFPGSRWWKFDFHTHTPIGSDDYKGDKQITAREWLQAYRSNGLDCVVVTDHNSGSWVNELTQELKTLRDEDEGWKFFYIFPGVEISCSGGIHLLAILDTDKTANDVAALVGACEYNGNHGDSDATTVKSVEQVIEAIHNKGGIAIAAHVDTEKGLLFATKDETTRSQILKNLDAVQVISLTSALLQEKNTHTNADGLGQNSHEVLSNLAQLQASDNHNAAKIKPDCFTWVKLTTPDLQGLKLALLEPELSIRRSDQQASPPETSPKRWIQSLSIQDLNKRKLPMTVEFNPWLNTLIGGRGSGKSSIVECLRLALGYGDTQGEENEVSHVIKKFREGMVVDTTSLKVTVSGAGKFGGVYRFDWTTKSHLVQRPDGHLLGNWVNTEIQAQAIPGEFPVRIFSQKQIYALANRPEGLLDYFDSSGFENQWQKILACKQQFRGDTRRDRQHAIQQQTGGRSGSFIVAGIQGEVGRFENHREDIRSLRQELSNWPQIKDQLAQVSQSLETYATQGVSDKLVEFQKLNAEKRAIDDFKINLQAEIQKGISSIQSPSITDLAVSLPVNASPEAKKLADKWHQERSDLTHTWEDIKHRLEILQSRTEALGNLAEFHTWKDYATSAEQNCLQTLETIKTQLGGQLQPIGVLQQQKEELDRQNEDYHKKHAQLTEAITKAEESYKTVKELRKKITEVRQAFVDKVIGEQSKAILKITFHVAAKYDDITRNELRDLLKLSQSADYVNAFLDRDEPNEKGIMSTLKSQPERLDELKQALQAIVDNPLAMPEQIMGMPLGGHIRNPLKTLSDAQLDELWAWFPEDRVEIQFRASPKDNWQDISKGSAGQQTGALLSFILSEGDDPLILDQPEDDLDNAMVYDLVVQQLRQNKSRRQVIVVTHNANIVVNGDAELVIPMAFRGGQIQADAANGLQNIAIRKTICDIMEGGKTAFCKRYKRVLKDMN